MTKPSNTPKQVNFLHNDIMLFIKEGIEKKTPELKGQEFEIILTSIFRDRIECLVKYL